LIDRRIPELACDTVTLDNIKGVSLLVDHLVALGRRDIALLTLPFEAVSPRSDRVRGYKEALERHGIAFKPEFLIESDTNEAAVRERLTALFARGLRPNAVFGFNNLMTIAIIKALSAMELVIPDDIAVIGFDDWEWAPLIQPPVTVIAQPAYEMGSKAASLLINRIQGKKISRKPVLAVYQPQLIIRSSCGEKLR
jgi:DNA-binding LacI/PurR family transcriptional regulator